jgi:predicted transposase YbfD/YdcC
MDYINIAANQEISENGLVYDLGSLYDYLLKVPDVRGYKGRRYSLISLLVVMVLAKLGGEDKPSGITDWVAERLAQLKSMGILVRDTPPCHMTYRRVLQQVIDAEVLDALVQRYHQQCLKTEPERLLTMDGKTMCGTIPAGEMRGTHLLTVYAPDPGLVLAQAPVEKKENEITVAPQILEQVNVSEAIVMGDAMHTQRDISRQIVGSGGHYIWFVKDNQPRTRWAIEKLFVHEMCNLRQGAQLSKDIQVFSKTNKGHGRIETRTIYVSALLNDYLEWPHVAQVFRLERTRWHNRYKGKTREIVYGLTDLSQNQVLPKRLLKLTREYWSIENGLHYRRDVTLGEDATRMTKGHAARNMAILNNLVIGLCLRRGYSNVAQARRRFCAHPDLALQLILRQIEQTC